MGPGQSAAAFQRSVTAVPEIDSRHEPVGGCTVVAPAPRLSEYTEYSLEMAARYSAPSARSRVVSDAGTALVAAMSRSRSSVRHAAEHQVLVDRDRRARQGSRPTPVYGARSIGNAAPNQPLRMP